MSLIETRLISASEEDAPNYSLKESAEDLVLSTITHSEDKNGDEDSCKTRNPA